MTFFSPGVVFPIVGLGWSKSQVVNGSLQVRYNYIVGGAAVFDVHAWQSVTASGNTLAPGGGGEVVRLNDSRSEEHTSELQSQSNLVCRLLLEKKKKPN